MTFDAHSPATLEQARRDLFDRHFDDPNFTGCAIGRRRRAGAVVDEPVVVAMVAKKLSEGFVSRRRLLPKTIDVDGAAVGVDVVEVGRLARHGRASGPIPDRLRPPLQGGGISNTHGSVAGSIGCFVRDNTDGTINILSSNHVVGRMSAGSAGETVAQPAAADSGGTAETVAKLKRSVAVSTTATDNLVDAAIAQLDDQSAYAQDVARGLMAPISAGHPVVGMVVAGDAGTNCFLTPIGHVLEKLDVSLLPAGPSSPCTIAPQIGMHIEKVGRASGYSSSTVDALAAQVKIDFSEKGDRSDVRVLSDLVWTQAFNLPGDSGAIACQGGDGMTFVVKPRVDCPFLGAVGGYYDLPLVDDNPLTTKARDEFFSQSLTGNLLISVLYQNSQVVIDRLQGKTADPDTQAYARGYYDQYHDLLAGVLADPDSTVTVTDQNLNDVLNIILGMSGAFGVGEPVLTGDETNAALNLYDAVLSPTLGMDRAQILDYMQRQDVYQQVIDQASTVPTIEVTGPVSAG
ncbi:hypothetical protein [Actinomadura napierensis]|uniref:Uncharacterized protein n=1 Tax=Actinomadura napierensis TaxID=267854 RepID=A0ABP5KBC7_9ACTN